MRRDQDGTGEHLTATALTDLRYKQTGRPDRPVCLYLSRENQVTQRNRLIYPNRSEQFRDDAFEHLLLLAIDQGALFIKGLLRERQ